MSRLAEIRQQLEALIKEEAEILIVNRANDLNTVRALCKQHGFSMSEVGPHLKARKQRVDRAHRKARKPRS